MRIQMSFFRSVASLMAILCLAGLSPAQHIHDQHPTTVHTDFVDEIRIEMSEWWGPLDVRGSTPEIETLWDLEFQNCNPDNCVTTQVNISESTTRTHSVTVGGKVEIGGEVEADAGKIASLFVELKVKAHASVEFSGSHSTEWIQTFTIEVSSPLLPCKTTRYLKQIKHYTSTGTQDYAAHRGVCVNIDPWCEPECTLNIWFCNFETLSGDGNGYTSHINGWFQAESCEDLGVVPCDCLPTPFPGP